MKIRHILLSKEKLLQIAPAERAFFLLAGHILNEINSLNKVFSWCLSNSSKRSKTENLADGMQAMIYARILTGKLCEAWEVLGKAFFGTKLSQRVEPNLHPTAQAALKMIKAYFSKTNYIHQIRNSFAFHYSANQFDCHWEEAANEPNFEMILGGTVGNNISFAGEFIANMAMLNGINNENTTEALKAFFEEVQSIASSFSTFFEGMLLSVIEECFGGDLTANEQYEEIVPGKAYDEVEIPFFVKPITVNEET